MGKHLVALGRGLGGLPEERELQDVTARGGLARRLAAIEVEPAELVLSAHAVPEGARIDLVLRGGTGEATFVNEAGYRPLSWSDLQALAEADGATVERDGADRLRLSFAWAA